MEANIDALEACIAEGYTYGHDKLYFHLTRLSYQTVRHTKYGRSLEDLDIPL
jgi:hypothetical protein